MFEVKSEEKSFEKTLVKRIYWNTSQKSLLRPTTQILVNMFTDSRITNIDLTGFLQ